MFRAKHVFNIFCGYYLIGKEEKGREGVISSKGLGVDSKLFHFNDLNKKKKLLS